MKEKNKFLNKYQFLFLIILIVIGLSRLIYMFSLRDGHHVDETWSYGYANSYYDPFIYSSSRNGDVTDRESWKNINEWLPGSVFKDYVTVQEDEKFSFDSVLYNKEFDLGPALYTLILHFVCSLFPGVFSWSYALAINLVIFAFSMILVYLISKEFSNSILAGLFSVLFFMFSGSGTANFLYLRIYSLFTFWVLALFYFMVRLIKCNFKHKNAIYVLLPVVTILGCMTHYYFLVIAFFLTLFSAIALLVKKRYLDSLTFCIDMLFSVILFFVIYRPAFNMLLPFFKSERSVSGTAGHSLPYSWNISTANIHFFMGTVGYFINFTFSLIMYAVGIIVFCVITVSLLAFLFRNEIWFKKLISFLSKLLKTVFAKIFAFLKNFDISIYVAVIASLTYFLVIPFTVELYDMGYVERYLFPAMSLFMIGYSSAVAMLLIRLVKKRERKVLNICLTCLLSTVLVYFSLRSNVLTDEFKFAGMNEKALTAEMEGEECYVLIHAVRDLVWLSPILGECTDVYIDLAGYIPLDDHVIPDLDSDCLLMINTTDFLTEEQKESYEDSGDIELIGMRRPVVYMTVEDYIKQIEDQTGYTYSLVDESQTFVGDLRVYRAN